MPILLCTIAGLVVGVAIHWAWSRTRASAVIPPPEPAIALSTDERVQQMLDRFNVAIETAGFSPWEIDARTGKFVWAENRIRLAGLSQLPLDEYGDALSKLMHPDDYAEMLQIARTATSGSTTGYSYRYRLMRPDGLIRHMQSHVRIVRDAEGAALRLMGATTDITNEVQTNELLIRQAEQERLLLDRLNIATQAAGISSWEIDLHERRFLWIENPIEGFQVPEDEYSLDAFLGRIHPEDRGLVLDQLKLARSRGQDRLSYRFRTLSPDERVLHIQVNARMLFDESGRVARLLGVSWDVTKEVEAAAQLKEQAAHERMLLDRLAMSTQAAGISSWEYDFES